eukprot:TRINITY_DN14329_c1_g1_i1.p1 TRINITY_DN14329_c1_g1~~TRINITY_DN14329_c1_g1_i1.p1  ORF type:complete len:385 (+),score=31.27 TRINITY_DN14329_c1_g1_i1:34-1188(+)
MANIVTTVKNTFVHVKDSECFETSRTSRPRASSAPARVTLDVRSLDQKACAAENENSFARAPGEPRTRLEDSSLLQHDEDQYMSMSAHSGPSPLGADVEGTLGGSVPEMEVVDHLWGRPVAQRKDEVGMNLVGMAKKNILSSDTREHSASTLVYHGSTHRTHVPQGSGRDGPARNPVSLSTALYKSAEFQCFSTSPLSTREEQMGSCRQSFFGIAPATVLIRPNQDEAHAAESRTTVMLMNVPCGYTSSRLILTIDSEGFAGMYDFLYVPVNFGARSTLQYAFVNLVNPLIAQRFITAFDGFSRWSTTSKNVCHTGWAKKHQGLNANIDYYRNTTVMARSVPLEFKPRIFHNGTEIPFPLPLRTPHKPTSTQRAKGPRKTKRHN